MSLFNRTKDVEQLKGITEQTNLLALNAARMAETNKQGCSAQECQDREGEKPGANEIGVNPFIGNETHWVANLPQLCSGWCPMLCKCP